VATTPTVILVDGFAGSGKSTTAQRLWLDLAAAGTDAVWFHEHEAAHPIFQYGEVAELLRWRPRRFEDALLARWEVFAAARDRRVRIVEGSLLQIPVGLMLAMNVSPSRIQALLGRIDRVIARVGPALVHLVQPDPRAALERVAVDRGSLWLEEMTAVLGKSPYGRRHRVRTLEGLVEYYRRQHAIVDAALPSLSLRRLTLDVSGAQWNRHARRISTWLGISPRRQDDLAPAALLDHAGQYRGTTTGRRSVVTTDGTTLYLALPASYAHPLLRVAPGRFCLRSLPIDVRFTYDGTGRARRFAYESRMVNEAGSDRTWVRA
jgi:hypothetical protein